MCCCNARDETHTALRAKGRYADVSEGRSKGVHEDANEGILGSAHADPPVPVSPTPRPLYPCRKECDLPIKQAAMSTAQPVTVICKTEQLRSPAGGRTPNRQARRVDITVRQAGDKHKNDALSCNARMCMITHTGLPQAHQNIRCSDETNKCI